MVAKTIGTIVSFAWENTTDGEGKRPTTGWKKWCDCTSHPDFNPEPDQIETTTLCEKVMHTYEDGLFDYGTLEFGANLTNETYEMFLGEDGLINQLPTKEAQSLRLWVCVDIQGIGRDETVETTTTFHQKSFYVPVKPIRFGLPAGEAGSNKYDLIVRFAPAAAKVAGSDDAGWYDEPTSYAE